MKTQEFLKKVRDYAKKNNKDYFFDPDHGKGSHGRVIVGEYFTTAKKGEFGPGLLNKMLVVLRAQIQKDLRIDKKDFLP